MNFEDAREPAAFEDDEWAEDQEIIAAPFLIWLQSIRENSFDRLD